MKIETLGPVGTPIIITEGSSNLPKALPTGKMLIIDQVKIHGSKREGIKILGIDLNGTRANKYQIMGLMSSAAEFAVLDLTEGGLLNTALLMNSYPSGTEVKVVANTVPAQHSESVAFPVGSTHVIEADTNKGDNRIVVSGVDFYTVHAGVKFILTYDPLSTYDSNAIFIPGVQGPIVNTYIPITKASGKGSKGWQPDVPDPNVDLMKSIRDACNGKL